MNLRGLCYLDRMRIRLGQNGFRQWFRESLEQNTEEAMQAFSSDKLLFPSLFLLLPDIEARNLYPYMNSRVAYACRFCVSSILRTDEKCKSEPMPEKSQRHRIFKWIFTTGKDWDAPYEGRDAFDTIMDAAASHLIVDCGDQTILPALVDLIFKRNQSQLLVHDLVWCFYKACDPNSLRLIADHLLSENPAERELACKILHLPFDGQCDKAASLEQYNDYMTWLNENRDCLCFTGECFQLTSEPEPVRVNLEAKYLRKKVSPKDGRWLEPLTPEENGKLDRFRNIPDTDRETLAAYSHHLHRRNRRSWNQWMQRQHDEQIHIAAAGLEALYDHHK